MSADEKRNEQVEEELKDTAESASQEKGGTGDAPENAPENETEALKAQAQEFQEQMLRFQAEMQNVRRRAEIDVEKAHKFALEKFVKELLPVADSLEKAVESTEAQEDVGNKQVASIREGVEMTLSLFMNSLRKFNVEQLNPLGEPFDPQQHEALSMVPAPDSEPNSVVAVVQKGYTLNNRVVRPAMVMVAKAEGSPKIDEQA
ncbi:nucleotide exchange factor GrpE [Marinobacter orientalis]|uniref:Protein GrpE n=1 Tax=Marinobacter orientalis TaxID=1928859 RepID=A0A7Y0R988_9GAMM|nr:nucleotide exchange factor GrpE [Marinobacter orientalis]NMT62265.1 nucleotide exchange factor GrpE [Marinobacter orientalis]TGX50979.1 nucleotide exchange factor GrpE [Marinobacter orientalis]